MTFMYSGTQFPKCTAVRRLGRMYVFEEQLVEENGYRALVEWY
jgi:hypothetical protein